MKFVNILILLDRATSLYLSYCKGAVNNLDKQINYKFSHM